jgi:hypothetical protein
MYSYTEQLRTVERLKVKDGDTERFNCPFCNGYNTLGVTNNNGILQWHCFKASCEAHGMYDKGLSIYGIQKKLDNDSDTVKLGKPIPFLVDYTNHEDVIEYLKDTNSYDAAEKQLVNVKYSPAENRVLFGLGRFSISGYTGRRLGQFGPKWVKYGDTSSLFTCGNGKIGVIVEDAPSACAVGIIEEYTGISLLGTNLTPTHKIEIINNFSSVLVCLDPDAATKSLKLSQQLEGFIRSSVRLIPDDLKNYKPNKIKEILNG